MRFSRHVARAGTIHLPCRVSAAIGEGLRHSSQEAGGLIQKFEGHDFWGWKDQRNSLTVPFWRPLVGGFRVLVCVRNPLEVAVSLRRRGFSSYALGLSLWVAYNEHLLQATEAGERVVTHYATYFTNPVAETRRVTSRLGVSVSDDRLEAGCGSLRQDLRHTCWTVGDLRAAGVSTRVLEMYARLCAEAEFIETVDEAATDEPVEVAGRTSNSDGARLGRVDVSVVEGRLLLNTTSGVRNPALAAGDRSFDAKAMRVELEARDDALRELNARLTSKEGRLREAEALVVQRDVRIGALITENEQATLTLGQRDREVQKRDEVIASLKTVIDDKEATLSRYRDEIATRDQIVADLESRQGELLMRQNELAAGLARSESATRAVQAALDERAAENQRAIGEARERDLEMREAESRREELLREQGVLAARLAESEGERSALQAAFDSQAKDMHHAATEIASRDRMISLLEQQLERSTGSGGPDAGLVRDLQLQLAERSSWAFRMVEGFIQMHANRAGDETEREVPLSTSRVDTAVAVEPRQLSEAFRQQGEEVSLLRDQLAAVEEELAAAREAARRLEMDLGAERDARRSLGEVVDRGYEQMRRRLLESMGDAIPRNATVLMVSGGDEHFGRVTDWSVRPFPQTDDGAWSDHIPANGASAVAHLEVLRAKGASHLVVPDPARWWLERYPELRTHIRRYRTVFYGEDTGLVIDMREPVWQRRLRVALATFEERFGRQPALLDWDSGLDLAALFPDHAVFSPPDPSSPLPYLDGSVDIAVCPSRVALAGC